MRKEEQIEMLAPDCVYFRGDRPCVPHLRQGVSCRCHLYSPRSSRLLLIQLGDPTRVIRSSALVYRLKGDDPNSRLTYLTDYPELLPSVVDEPLTADAASILYAQSQPYDLAINLDLSARAGALMNLVSATAKKGLYLRQAAAAPLDEDANATLLRALLPRTWGRPAVSEVEEMFHLAGLEYLRETPHLQGSCATADTEPREEMVVGLCPAWELDRAPGRQTLTWPKAAWQDLIDILGDFGMEARLLGDRDADGLNRELARAEGTVYPGPLNWRGLLAEVEHCDVLLTPTRAAAEAALARGRRVVRLALNDACQANLQLYHGRATWLRPQVSGKRDLGMIDARAAFGALMDQMNQIPERDGGSADWGALAAVYENLQSVRQHVGQQRHRG